MFPVLIYQVWSFVRPALKRTEAAASLLVFARSNNFLLRRSWLWVFLVFLDCIIC